LKKKYYYLFGVRADPATSKIPGKLSLDFCIEYTDEEISKTELAKIMAENKAIKTSKEEAVRACGLSNLFHEINGASFRVGANMLSTHKVNSDSKMDREMLSTWVDSCNYDDVAKQKLKASRVRI